MISQGQQSFIKLVLNATITTSVAKVVKDQILSGAVLESRTDKILTRIGRFALGGVIAEQVWLQIEPKVDTAFNVVDAASKLFTPDEEVEEVEDAEEVEVTSE